MTSLMASPFNVPTLLLILGVVLLLFGAAKIPALMRSLGSGMKEFKNGLAEGEKHGAEKPSETVPKA